MQSQRNNRRPGPKSAPTDKAEPQPAQPQPAAQSTQNANASQRSRIYRQPCRQRLEEGKMHVYLFEVHDFVDKKTYGERFWGQVRDITAQAAVEIPLSLIKPLIEHLIKCKCDEAELEHDEEDEKEEEDASPASAKSRNAPTLFDLELLENKQIRGLDDTFALEIGDVPEASEDAPSTKLLTCLPLGGKEEPTAGGDNTKGGEEASNERRDLLKPKSRKGSIVITEWLLPRLILFLKGIYIRHLDFTSGCPEVRNLYAPSGSRRFYFDIHETKWGARLQISQVTTMHRNTISIPLESLVLFRNRLNTLIDRMGIDDFSDLRVARSPRPVRENPAPAAAASPNRNRKVRGLKANGRAGVRPYNRGRPFANRYFAPLRG